MGKTFPGPFYTGSLFRTHAHHIVMRHGPKNAEAAAAVAESQRILGAFGIELDSQQNMIWAPNRGHSTNYATNVLAELKKKVDKNNNPIVTQREFIEFLADIGNRFIRGQLI